ncbi:S9 family peptidase, partial [bacterium]
MVVSSKFKKSLLLTFLGISSFSFSVLAAEKETSTIPNKYMMPPKEISAIVDAPLSPVVSISHDNQYMLLMTRAALPSIAEFAAPELKVAGIRINPLNHGSSRALSYNDLKLKKVSSDKAMKISGLPDKAKINYVTWSPDSKKIAFANTKADSIEIWIINIETKQAKQLSKIKLNATFGKPFQWLSDSKSLVCTVVPGDIGPEPANSKVPTAPVVQESIGKKAASRTYPDLITNKYDEKMFKHHFSSKLVKLHIDGGMRKLTDKMLIANFEVSPNGNYILTQAIHEPFSYVMPYYIFPEKTTVIDISGKVIKVINDSPLEEEMSTAFDAVPKGKREISWRADNPATLYWVEAQDKGDPKVEAKIRDTVYTLDAPFTAKAKPFISLESRFNSIIWGDNKVALVKERWWKTRKEKTWMLPPDFPQFKPKLIFDRSYEDKYTDPGLPLTKAGKFGTQVLYISNDNALYMSGDGASPEGNMPFLDKFDLKALKSKRLWRSAPPYFENFLRVIDE